MSKNNLRSHKKLYIDLAILVMLVLLSFSNFFQSLELKALDIFRADHNPHPDLVILAIDNKSLEAIGRWPWDRSVHAGILEKLGRVHPRVLAIDVNFSEVQDLDNDSQLNTALERANFPVVLASEAIYVKNSDEPQRFLKPLKYFYPKPNVSSGHVNVISASDGLIREFPHPISVGSDSLTSFSYELASVLGLEAPNQERDYYIDFVGPAGSIPTYSISDFLDEKIDVSNLQDKIVFLGATASDLHDVVSVPVRGGVMSGVEWHANVLDNLLQQREVLLIPKKYLLLLSFLLGLVLLMIFWLVSTRSATVVYVVISAGLFVSSLLLWHFRLALPYLVNFAIATCLFLSQALYRWYLSEAEKRKLRETMQHYFSPQVMDYIMKHPEQLKLGGERREVTMLFSDIRSFTTITESTDPEILSALLHEYFTEMTEEVLATDGVVDKFIGDAVMAFWGAPLDQADQADRALQAGLGMLKRLEKLQSKWAKKGWPEVKIGIGIHTGMATVGNMGSEKRFDYTVIGDAVNAAARLEGLTKEYKTPLIISEITKNKLKNKHPFTHLGSVTVKGKTKALSIYGLTSSVF